MFAPLVTRGNADGAKGAPKDLPGQPSTSGDRAFLEPRFSYEFGNVRLHPDGATGRNMSASSAPMSLGARAGEVQKEPASGSGGPLLRLGAVALQRRLTVGASDDPFEREADRVAERVMRMPEAADSIPQRKCTGCEGEHKLQRKCTGCEDEEKVQRKCTGCEDEEKVQRKCTGCEDEEKLQRKCTGCEDEDRLHRAAGRVPVGESAAPAVVHELLLSPGHPLDAATRSLMEPRFGRDFSHVRVHTGAVASRSAEAVRARAFTVGSNIAFQNGQYAPGSPQGQRLLAHELAHVVQQGAAGKLDSTATHPLRPNGAGYRIQRQAEDAGPPSQPGSSVARELNEEDEKSCSPLYLQKLCVFIDGGFNGDRSGGASPEEMKGYNANCRKESGYPTSEPDVQISDGEKVTLRAPKCNRGDPDTARRRAHGERLAAILDRSSKYFLGGAGEEVVRMLKDPIFIGTAIAAITAYVGLLLFPEPISKIAWALTTVALLSTGLFSFSVIKNVAEAWMDVDSAADTAQTDEEKEQAAERFGKRMGAVDIDCLIFLASLLVGGKLPTPKTAPAATKVLADAEILLNTPKPDGVVVRGPWGGKAFVNPPSVAAAAKPQATYAFDGSNPLKVEFFAPAEVEPVPEVATEPAAGPAKAASPAVGSPAKPVVPVAPGVRKDDDQQSPESASMRHQIQQGKSAHYASLAASANAKVGVTAQELRSIMAENFEQFKRIARGGPLPKDWTRGSVKWESPIWSAIMAQSKAITPLVAAGGYWKGGDINALRKCFDPRSLAQTDCASDDIRLDVENKGHNLKS
jgi:hypothetical protein